MLLMEVIPEGLGLLGIVEEKVTEEEVEMGQFFLLTGVPDLMEQGAYFIPVEE